MGVPRFSQLLCSALALGFLPACQPHQTEQQLQYEVRSKLYRMYTTPQRAEYLAQARAADKIADPLERCLHFPDIPNTHWPKGLTDAHCRWVYGPRVSADEVQAALDTNQLAALEARYSQDLERHFSDTQFSEAIHGDFDAFDGSERSNRLSRAWLDRAPSSPFALAARGEHFRRAARDARGVETVDKVPEAQMQRMEDYARQAIRYFKSALALEPRLLPAHAGLVHLGMLVSDADLVQSAATAGRQVDPACMKLDYQIMWSLTPRWGGSEAQLEAFADELRPLAERRPLLALALSFPRKDRADLLWRDGRDDEAANVLRPAAMESTDPEIYKILASASDTMPGLTMNEPLVYALAASRFSKGDVPAALERGSMLLVLEHDPEWALPTLQFAVAEAPENGRGHMWLADALAALGRDEAAQQEFKTASSLPDLRREALTHAVRSWTAAGRLELASESLDALEKDFPEAGPEVSQFRAQIEQAKQATPPGPLPQN